LIRRVYSYVAYRIGAGQDAEDVTSEAFERALRYRESFDPRQGDTLSWLIGIARRCIADHGSRAPQEPLTLNAVVDSHETATLQSIELAGAVAALPERDREILALRFGADLTAREIARLLDLRTNTIEVALHRALGRLRSELTAEPARRADQVTAPAADATYS
jgi:RNA polymerase sigma-70 factor (ECF subfamily)